MLSPCSKLAYGHIQLSCTALVFGKMPGTLGLSGGYGVGNPRESVSGQFTSLVNWGEQVNSPYSLGEQDIPS